ncbi:thioredoxin domain-containing protein [Glaciibacter sp. 2TAF33]|uniref:thioredoxin domain-containing protein n=1 Tax=Glaciibacter sp. 2TAF33 TaxID=3233015 RepID=UPI003F90DF70
MPNRLADAISPYLRSHADNPVDWHQWGTEAFAEAAERDVPVLVSIGYSTCHWCHVMARESFSDPALAAYLNERFVSIKVDREEHPDVDSSYLAAAGAFTENLGWPLNVFVTPEGKAFYAGTYFAPQPLVGRPSFGQVLEAVTDAWTSRRGEVTEIADRLATALVAVGRAPVDAAEHAGVAPPAVALPDDAALARTVAELWAYEDTTYGGFGGAPKFPAAPTLGFLLERPDGRELALRTLKRMGASPLRDPVEGGFFRYAVNRDWSDPHYERMLYDNAQLLGLYTRAWVYSGEQWARAVAEGIAGFLTDVMRMPGGGFASAQDSESTVDGRRTEGGYYALEEEDRAAQAPPARDEKILTGWNGLAVQALARAGFTFDAPELTAAARRAADFLLHQHQGPDGTLVRASIGDRTSAAQATLEDYGMFASGLLELALATGDAGYATAARRLVDSTLAAATDTAPRVTPPFGTPNGADPVLAAQGLAIALDPSEGAYPSGLTATADAAHTLFLLTADHRYLAAAHTAMGLLGPLAPTRPLAFGAALRLMARLAAPIEQLVVVSPDGAGDHPPDPVGLVAVARQYAGSVVASVTAEQARMFADAGFELFAERPSRDHVPTAYLCHDFVCRLPVTDPASLREAAATA